MGISIYYSARRTEPMTSVEQAAISSLIAEYAIEEQLQDRDRTGEGPNWESFCVYQLDDPHFPAEPGVIFEGATGLPDNSEDNFWLGIQHWCALLSKIRRAVGSAVWSVHIDAHDVYWDEERQEYDPSA